MANIRRNDNIVNVAIFECTQRLVFETSLAKMTDTKAPVATDYFPNMVVVREKFAARVQQIETTKGENFAREFLNEHKLALVELIYTFSEHQQMLGYIAVTLSCTETEFLSMAFSVLPIEKVKQLVKISCCQFYTTSLTPALGEDGKFYFNTDVNTDDTTARHRSVLNEFVAKKENLAAALDSASLKIKLIAAN